MYSLQGTTTRAKSKMICYQLMHVMGTTDDKLDHATSGSLGVFMHAHALISGTTE